MHLERVGRQRGHDTDASTTLPAGIEREATELMRRPCGATEFEFVRCRDLLGGRSCRGFLVVISVLFLLLVVGIVEHAALLSLGFFIAIARQVGNHVLLPLLLPPPAQPPPKFLHRFDLRSDGVNLHGPSVGAAHSQEARAGVGAA